MNNATKKDIVSQKLKLDERSVNNIMLNDELVERIINENPISAHEAVLKYQITRGLINQLIKYRISSFKNTDGKGSKTFVFEDELKSFIRTSTKYKTPDLFNNVRDIVRIFITCSNLNDREKEILNRLIFKNDLIDDVSSDLMITNNRVRQIKEKAIHRMLNHTNLLNEIQELEKRKLELSNFKNEEVSDDYLKNSILLNTKVNNMNLSVRTLNCLKAAEIETFGQLISHDKSYFIKCRNFGKKSLIELEKLVHGKGFNFGQIKINK